MSEDATAPPPSRLPTGIAGLDQILGGGVWRGGIYVVTGNPGAGKTTFANQMSFRFVADGGRAIYVTLLSETHARMLFQIGGMRFFQPAAVGSTLVYLNAFSVIEAEGLDGLLKMVRQSVRDQRAGLVVLDGMVTAGTLARTGIDYKKFINELQTWVGVVGCTVLFLTSAATEQLAQPENSMVDGIFELRSRPATLQACRYLSVTKFRGSAFSEGEHSYLITADGIVVYPRLEAAPRAAPPPLTSPAPRLSMGDPGMDRVLGGGLRPGTSTLVLGPPGSGKTTAGLQFLAAGLADGEPGLQLGFVEPPPDIAARGQALGIRAGAAITVLWYPAAETLPDRLAHDLLEAVGRTGARRVFIDGLFGFRSGGRTERLGGLIDALSRRLGAMGATTLISDEISELPTPVAESLTSSVAAFADNIMLFQNLNTGMETARLLTVLKTRQSDQDPRAQHYDLDGTGLRVRQPLDSPPLPPVLDNRRRPRATRGSKRRRK
jgi:circadian clock protein KaiC